MRSFLLSVSLSLLAAAAPLRAVEGTWQSLGPDGGPVNDLAFQPGNAQVLYAAVSGGVFKSTDGGSSWAWAGSGLDPRSQTSNLAVDAVQPDTVYAAQGGGVYKSADGGTRWRYTGRSGAYWVAAHPRFSGRVYAATELGLFRSFDAGKKWTRLSRGLPSAYRATLVVCDPTSDRRLYAAIQNLTTFKRGLFRSTDNGDSWRPIHGGPLADQRIFALAIDPRSPSTLYAGTDKAVYKTTDGGANWRATSLAAPGFVWTLKVHPRVSANVYAGTAAGLFRSQNGGATWTRLSQGLEGDNAFAIAFSPASARTLYAALAPLEERGGVFKSADGGSSWTLSSRGLFTLSIESIAVNPVHPDTLWVTANGVPFKSTDRGRTWTRVRPGPGAGDTLASRVAIDPVDGATVYLQLPGGALRRTRDDGLTWESAGNPGVSMFGTATLAIDPRDPATIYAAGVGIAKTTDGGATWTPLPGDPADMVFFDLVLAPASPFTLYGTGGGGRGGDRVVRSLDGGATWTRIQRGLSSRLLALAVDPLISTTVYGLRENEVYKTSDGGATWSLFSDTFRDLLLSPLAISPSSSGLLYGSVWFEGVYQIQGGGGTWEPLGARPFATVDLTLDEDPGDPCRVYAGTATRGLLAFTKSGTPECN